MSTVVQTSIVAARAVGAEFGRRLLQPILMIGAISSVVLIAIGGWLTTQHSLWWILEAILISWAVIFAIAAMIIVVVLRRFTPRQTSRQKKAVQSFADKLQRVSETIGISRFTLLFRIVRDVIHPPEQSYIKQIALDSTTLHTDFMELQKIFERSN